MEGLSIRWLINSGIEVWRDVAPNPAAPLNRPSTKSPASFDTGLCMFTGPDHAVGSGSIPPVPPDLPRGLVFGMAVTEGAEP